jgi:hypothetical protein
VHKTERVVADINERATMVYRLLFLEKPGIVWPSSWKGWHELARYSDALCPH